MARNINWLASLIAILKFRLVICLLFSGKRHILFATLPSPSVASVTADFGPFAVLLKVQNTPLRESPVPLFAKLKPFLDRYEEI